MKLIPTVQKERTRGTSLAVLVSKNKGVQLEEAIRVADQRDLVIASNPRLDKALMENYGWCLFTERLDRSLAERTGWRAVPEGWAYWTGTAFGHVEPGKSLREGSEHITQLSGYFIVYPDPCPAANKRWLFPVPEQYLDRADVLLAMNHPDFTLEQDGNDRLFRPKEGMEIGLVENFPHEPDALAYLKDPVFAIPHGELQKWAHRDLRRLWRAPKAVGLVVRDFTASGEDSGLIGLTYAPSGTLGVIVEASAADETQSIPLLSSLAHPANPVQILRS